MKVLSLIFLTTTLFAEPLSESTSLSSESADYNGNTLILKGQVVLDHGLGKMMAEQAFLEKQEAGKDFPFSFIRLQNQVSVQMPNRSELQCETADLDFVALKGVLYPKDQDKVTYIDNENQNVRLMSDKIELEMSKAGFDGKKTAYAVQSLFANGDVIIDYAKVFTLRADHAHYTKGDKQQGIITAHPKENMSCRLMHEGDLIEANTIRFDLGSSKLSFDHPKGVLNTPLVPDVQKGEISFSSDLLLWDHLKNTLVLKGKVHIQEPSLGKIDSDGAIQIIQAKNKGKRTLKSIRSNGKTVLEYEDAGKVAHKLVAHGPFFLDSDHLRVSIESPENALTKKLQIAYNEAELAVFADKAFLEYALVDESLQPVSLTLKGNVRLFSHDRNQPAFCGLSDRVVFSPATKTLILSADPSKKVLFWDEGQGLHVSSQEIHVTQDPATKQKAVKGIGNVKFAFTPEEDTMLHQHFSFYKVSNE